MFLNYSLTRSNLPLSELTRKMVSFWRKYTNSALSALCRIDSIEFHTRVNTEKSLETELSEAMDASKYIQ